MSGEIAFFSNLKKKGFQSGLKIKNFNTKKKILLEKHPELKSMKSVKRREHIKQTADNSLKITKAIMGFEFVDIPRLRSVEFEVTEYQSEQDAFNFLDQHIASPDYVEVVLMVFEDGKVMTYITSDNDANNSFYPTLVQKVSGGWYSTFNPDSPIAYIAHTHQFSSEPSQEDLDTKLDGLDERIYTSGGNLDGY